MQIRVDTSTLRATASELHATIGTLERIQSQLRSAMNGLAMSSRQRSDVDSGYQSIDRMLQELRYELQQIQDFATKKANQFDEADGKGAGIFSGSWKSWVKDVLTGRGFLPQVKNAAAVKTMSTTWTGRSGARLLDFLESGLDAVETGITWLDNKVKQGEEWIYAALDASTYNGQGREIIQKLLEGSNLDNRYIKGVLDAVDQRTQLEEHFKTGVAKGVIGTLSGVVSLALKGNAFSSAVRSTQYALKTIRSEKPLYTLQEDAKNGIANVKQLPGQVTKAVVSTIKEFEKASPNRKAEMLGYGIEKTAEVFVPLGAVVRSAKGAEELSVLTSNASKATAAVEAESPLVPLVKQAEGTRYAKPTDLFKEDTFAPNGQRIAPKNLYREMNRSNVGKETLDLIKQNNIKINLDYGEVPLDEFGNQILGLANVNTNTVRIYVKGTESVTRTTQTIIHEVTHNSLKNPIYTQREEIIAFMREAKHIKENLSFSEIRAILNEVKHLYPSLPYR